MWSPLCPSLSKAHVLSSGLRKDTHRLDWRPWPILPQLWVRSLHGRCWYTTLLNYAVPVLSKPGFLSDVPIINTLGHRDMAEMFGSQETKEFQPSMWSRPQKAQCTHACANDMPELPPSPGIGPRWAGDRHPHWRSGWGGEESQHFVTAGHRHVGL